MKTNTEETPKTSYDIRTTTDLSFASSLEYEIREDPFAVFAKHPFKDVRVACMERIGKLSAQNAPPGWMDAALDALGQIYYGEDQFFEPLLTWFVTTSQGTEKAASALERALRYANRYPRMDFIPKLIVGTLDRVLRRMGNLGSDSPYIPGEDLYWWVPGLHGYFEQALRSLQGDAEYLGYAYSKERWSLAYKAMNQVTASADVSLLPVLRDILGMLEGKRIRPNDTFLRYASLDHRAIVCARVLDLEAEEHRHRWDGASLKRIIGAMGVKDEQYRIDLHYPAQARIGESMTVRLSVEADDADILQMILLRLKKASLHSWGEGLEAVDAKEQHVKSMGTSWECRFVPITEMSRLWIGIGEPDGKGGDLVDYWRALQNKQAIYIAGI
ncbi:MAG TPA: hypothetical protein VMT99_04080 [Candidatus Paceibacterota bacterium]|nr:hypothetical protein [Candidatus Paceibacterota bacterium]